MEKESGHLGFWLKQRGDWLFLLKWEGGGDRKGLGRENKHYTLVRLVEIPLDIQVEVPGSPGIYKLEGQSWRVNTGKSLEDMVFNAVRLEYLGRE